MHLVSDAKCSLLSYYSPSVHAKISVIRGHISIQCQIITSLSFVHISTLGKDQLPTTWKDRNGARTVYLHVHWPVGHAHEVPQLHEQPGPVWNISQNVRPIFRGKFYPWVGG